jgi:hypothetical protein
MSPTTPDKHAQHTHAENPYAGQGPVLLDIGGEVGALVVTMPAGMDGVEVEIRPAGDDHVDGDRRRPGDHAHSHGHHRHVAVVARPTPAGVVHSLVFGDLAAGRYRLHPLPSGPVGLEVEVLGGQVTEAVWD